MSRANKDLIVGIYFDQGSSDLKVNAQKILENNFKRTVDLIELHIRSRGFLKIAWLMCLAASIYYYSKFVLRSDQRIKNLFWDGARQNLTIGSLNVTGKLKIPYYLLRQVLKLARFIYLVEKKDIDVIAFPDEVYGGVLLSFYCYENRYTVLTNFTDSRGSFSINTYASGTDYRFNDRYLVSDTECDLKMKSASGVAYIREIFGGASTHRDFSKAYGNKNTYKVSTEQIEKHRYPKILIALHNITDAPAALNMPFNSFESWYAEVRKQLSKTNCDVYVKDHPTAVSLEHSKFIHELKEDLPTNFSFIPSCMKVELCDFDVVLSCDGSILYEAAAKGVRGISFAVGNGTSLSTVNFYDPSSNLLKQIKSLFEKDIEIENDYVTIHNWHARHDLYRFGKNHDITIPDIRTLNINTSYRSVYVISEDQVVFKQTL